MKIRTQRGIRHDLRRALGTAVALTLGLGAGPALAANYGTDLNLTMTPAAGGMGGVGIARPQDSSAAVFGNPATLSSYDQATHFSFGATFYQPQVSDTHDGSTTGSPWKGDSEADEYLIPSLSIIQPLGGGYTFGMGVTPVAGIGSDFRGTAGSLAPLAELIVWGANAGVAYRVNERWSIGGAVTLGNGYFQAGLLENTASVHGYGLRATLGASYENDAVVVGAYYRSPLSIDYDRAVKYSATGFHDVTVEQPQELALGLAGTSLMDGNLLLEFDAVWKNWEDAEFYQDIYEDQVILAVGAQLTMGRLQARLGYSHADSPIKDDVGASVGVIDSALIGGGTVALNPVLVQYLQATNAEVVWEDQITVGLGYRFNPGFSGDAHFAYALESEETIGATKVEASAYQLGVGLTWRFRQPSPRLVRPWMQISPRLKAPGEKEKGR